MNYLSFPVECDSPRKRFEYSQRTLKLLLNLHNSFVAWRDVGIDFDTWNAFPARIKDAWPYKDKITQSEFRNFFREDFETRLHTVFNSIATEKANLEKSNEWDNDIDLGEIQLTPIRR